MKWIYTAFWVFIGVMLLWQFHTYNSGIDKKIADAGPRQEHFFFNAANSPSNKPPPKPDAAQVKQVGYVAEMDKPSPGNFVCHVTLKNVGNMKATAVEVIITPFHGAVLGDDTLDGDVKILDENDAFYNISQSLPFPDLAPGQSATRDAVFTAKTGYKPGENPNPTISFKSVKPDAATTPASSTPPTP